MTKSSAEHRVFIVNEANKSAFVEPEILPVKPGDEVLFVVAGEKEKFRIAPETNVFRSIEGGEEIPVGHGSPSKVTIGREAELHSIHRYEVYSQAAGSIDPILIIYD